MPVVESKLYRAMYAFKLLCHNKDEKLAEFLPDRIAGVVEEESQSDPLQYSRALLEMKSKCT